ncbi:MAG: hypothetical protein PUC65_07740 [Clostridiales bacterium]|nr:hypothetical protein [Clostridiales bacterium]
MDEFIKPCEFATSITAIACLIAKDKDCSEVALLAAFFTQLGDTLTTMVAYNETCCSDNETSETTFGAIV